MESVSISSQSGYKEELTASILTQIQAELYQTEVYQSVLKTLEKQLDEREESAQVLLEAVARQAIWLALKQVAKNAKEEKVTGGEKMSGNRLRVLGESPSPCFSPEDIAEWQTAQGEFSDAKSNSANGKRRGGDGTDRSDRNSKFQRGLQKLFPSQPTGENTGENNENSAETWKAAIRQMGEELKRARQERSLSLEELHRETLVPLHHLQALENGNIDRLPEHIYVRSFIHKIGEVMGLEGTGMAACLSVPLSETKVVPSWSAKDPKLGFSLSPVHLYLGYTALMAGAIGGLAWMSEQTASENLHEPDPGVIAPATETTAPTSSPGVSSSPQSFAPTSGIAPPEAIIP